MMSRRMAMGILLMATTATTIFAGGVSGRWDGKMTGGGGNAGTFVVLHQAGGQLTGTFGPDPGNQQFKIENGKVSGNKLSFRESMQFPGGITAVFDFDLTVDGDSAMHGTFTLTGGGQKNTGNAEFKRLPG